MKQFFRGLFIGLLLYLLWTAPHQLSAWTGWGLTYPGWLLYTVAFVCGVGGQLLSQTPLPEEEPYYPDYL